MNFTLTRLSLSPNSGSPILSLPSTLTRKNLGIFSLFAWKSFSPFLIGDSSSDASLLDSCFTSFLSSVIRLTGTDQTIINDTSSLAIKGTLFENGFIEDSSLFAVLHVANGWLVTITDCLFKNNYGKYKLSSIYAVLSAMNVSCSIFTLCRTNNNGDEKDGNTFLFVDCISKATDCLFHQSWIEGNSADGVYAFHQGKSITKRVNSTECKANRLGESAGTALSQTGFTTFEFIHGERGYGHNFLRYNHNDQIMRFVDTFNVINGTYENSLIYSASNPTTFKNGFFFGNNRENVSPGIILVNCFGNFNATGVINISFTLTHSISFAAECKIFPTASFSFKPFVKLFSNQI